jgi:phage gp36-like protein
MYCDYDDLKARLAEPSLIALSDDDGDGVADAAVIAAAIADAAAEIGALLAPRYAVPFALAPAIVRSLCALLAIERLYLRRHETLPDIVREGLATARALLGRLADGTADIGDPALHAGRALSDITTRGAEKTFGSEELAGF